MEVETQDRATMTRGTSRAVVVRQALHGVQVSGGDLSVVGGDVTVHHHHHDTRFAGTDLGIISIMQAIPNLRNIHIAILGKATPGTGAWIFQWAIFRLWLDPDGYLKIMWGSGMPGAGKTVLTSIIINTIEANAKASASPTCISVAYLYIHYSDHAKASVRTLLEVLAKQTVERQPGCLSLFKEFYTSHAREGTRPSEEDLLRLLDSFTRLAAATFYFVDALDEAPAEIQLDLVRKLASLNVKLFITSRPIWTVEGHFPKAHRFTIAARDCDLDLHISKELSRSVELRALFEDTDEGWQHHIASTIKQTCGGMFLHASLQLDALRECMSVYDVKKTLQDFPRQVEDIYRQTWNRILQQAPNKVLLAKRILVWVLNAARSLTVDELRCAVATSPETHSFDGDRLVPSATLISLCCGLITVEEETQLVRLAHYTAQEPLQRLLLHDYTRPHSLLAVVCMTRLIDCGFQRTELGFVEDLGCALRSDPLLAYAHSAWSIHARESLDQASDAARVAEFVERCRAFPVLLFRERLFDVLRPLHLVAYFNLPIHFAGANNMLNVNIRTPKEALTPLCVACSQHSHKAVEELLHLPYILVNATDKYQWTALIWASGYGDEAIVRLLLAHPQIDVNTHDKRGCTALKVASSSGHERTVKLLLAHPDIDVNQPDYAGWTALIEAAEWGHDGTIELLLAHPGIDVNHTAGGGRTALMAASESGHEGTVKLLLAHREVEADLGDERGRTALMYALKEGHEGTAGLLLARTQPGGSQFCSRR